MKNNLLIKENTIEEALIDLYLELKHEVNLDNDEDIALQKEKLKKIDSFAILGYLKSMIDIVANNRANNYVERLITNNKMSNNDYEEMLMHAESNIRSLIKTQHQMQLHTESLKAKIDDLEKRKIELKKENKEIKEEMSRLKNFDNEKEIKKLRSDIESMRALIQSYESQNLKITELEIKLRSQNIRYEKQMKCLEDKYQSRIKELNKNLNYYQDFEKKNTHILRSARPNRYIEEEEEINHENYREVLKNNRNSSPIIDNKTLARLEFRGLENFSKEPSPLKRDDSSNSRHSSYIASERNTMRVSDSKLNITNVSQKSLDKSTERQRSNESKFKNFICKKKEFKDSRDMFFKINVAKKATHNRSNSTFK